MIVHRRSHSRAKKSKKLLGVIVVLAIVTALAIGFFVIRDDRPAPNKQTTTPTNQPTRPDQTASKPSLVNLQPTLDEWVSKQSGDYGIVVYDPANKQVIASHQADKQYFTASIYKLYVVYLALQDVEASKHTLAEDFRFGKSRQTCLHDAIHSSDSPCAEALLAEIGNSNLNSRLQAFGFTNTSFPSFQTSAADAAKLLQRLQARQDLDPTSTNLILEAMKSQIYRSGLPKGMKEATVFDKVGFSETPNYHDVGIIALPNGREYLVAFLSQGSGSRPAADFGATIYAALHNQ